MLELEQKFVITNNTVKRLQELGFEKVQDVSMVDWYYDDPHLSFPLIHQDSWLRYRHPHPLLEPSPEELEEKGGQWELKRGEGGNNVQSKSTSEGNSSAPKKRTTIYHELEGESALKLVKELLLSFTDTETLKGQTRIGISETFEEQSVPSDADLPSGLQPFARIVTYRTKWKPTNNAARIHYANLTVDLDQTSFGYNVGEVEMLVPVPEHEGKQHAIVQEAKEQIQSLIDQLTQTEDSTQEGDETNGPSRGSAKGKLESYLQMREPLIYALLQELGLVD